MFCARSPSFHSGSLFLHEERSATPLQRLQEIQGKPAARGLSSSGGESEPREDEAADNPQGFLATSQQSVLGRRACGRSQTVLMNRKRFVAHVKASKNAIDLQPTAQLVSRLLVSLGSAIR